MAWRQLSDQQLEALTKLTETARGTEMGDLLRGFWQPVSLARQVEPGKAKPVRVFSEDFTLYRGRGGRPYLVAPRCAHRGSLLHTGWIEGEELRCIYHGWKYAGSGQCVEIPSEDPSICAKVQIASYPVHEYAGLIFAYLGDGQAPEFDLPRKEVFERPDRLLFTREQIWPANWFQQTENSMDAVHVSFVHQMGVVGTFGQAVTRTLPALAYHETDAGIRQIATRSPTNVRVSDWTFPNNNHIVVPGITKEHPWMDTAIWLVAIDDTRTSRFQVYSVPSMGEDGDREIRTHFAKHVDYDPSQHHDELIRDAKYPQEMALELTNAQDYVAVMGQGCFADRAGEKLVGSDAGIQLQRRLFWREMEAMRKGAGRKQWKQLNEKLELQTAVPGAARA